MWWLMANPSRSLISKIRATGSSLPSILDRKNISCWVTTVPWMPRTTRKASEKKARSSEKCCYEALAGPGVSARLPHRPGNLGVDPALSEPRKDHPQTPGQTGTARLGQFQGIATVPGRDFQA